MFITLGIIGLVVLAGAVWIKNGRKRGMIAALGGLLMLVYSISIHDAIFITLQSVFIISSLVEVVRPRK